MPLRGFWNMFLFDAVFNFDLSGEEDSMQN